jgi:protein-S-isoprenylcysteine O-methyltransferase Ste14
MKRIAILTYGVVCYAAFFATFLYAIGFIGNYLVPTSLDAAPEVPFMQALLVNTLLLGLFAVQHSVMARPTFKKYWTKVVPPAIERSTYVLASSLCLMLLFWLWQPMGGTVWDVSGSIAGTVLTTLFFLGWAIVLYTTFLIDHFDLFGLRQVWNGFLDREPGALKFVTPSLYRFVRHPLYVGWLMVFWMTPVMTIAHLVFALATTGYILIAIQLEERNLAEAHPEYAQYKRKVPMLIPSFRRYLGSKTGSLVVETN